MAMTGKERHNAAIAVWRAGSDMTDADLGRQLGCARQLIQKWHAQYRESVAVKDRGRGSVAPYHSQLVNAAHETSPAALERNASKRPLPALTTREAKIQRVEEALYAGCSRTASAALAEIPESTFWSWLRDDPVFKSRVVAAEARMQSEVVGNLKRIATSDKPGAHIGAAILLERRFPADFGKRVEIAHSGQIDERVDIRVMLSQGSPEEIARRIEMISAMEVELQNLEAHQLPAHSEEIDGEIIHEVDQ